MFYLWFVPAILEMLCLIGCFIAGASGVSLLGLSLYRKTWKKSKTGMAVTLLIVLAMFAVAAALGWVWTTQWIFTCKRFSFA
jgi:uncharacterized membrane protein SpoIIM required for sporulation